MTDETRKIDCDQAVKLLFQYLDNELERTNHAAMEKHLQSCRSCFSHMEFEKRLKNMIRESNADTAPDDLRARIKKLTERF